MSNTFSTSSEHLRTKNMKNKNKNKVKGLKAASFKNGVRYKGYNVTYLYTEVQLAGVRLTKTPSKTSSVPLFM